MAKQTYIFTMDEPITVCSKYGETCPFFYEDDNDGSCYCTHPNRPKEDPFFGRLDSASQNSLYLKPDWCPLKTID